MCAVARAYGDALAPELVVVAEQLLALVCSSTRMSDGEGETITRRTPLSMSFKPFREPF